MYYGGGYDSSWKSYSLCDLLNSYSTELELPGSIIAELRRAKRASGAPWVRKFRKPSIRENLVMTWRTPVHSLRGREGNQVSARPGEEYVINRAMHLCNPPFSWREIVQEMA